MAYGRKYMEKYMKDLKEKQKTKTRGFKVSYEDFEWLRGFADRHGFKMYAVQDKLVKFAASREAEFKKIFLE